jgi:hypothetical protein
MLKPAKARTCELGALRAAQAENANQTSRNQEMVFVATSDSELSTPPATALTAKYQVAGDRLSNR